MGIAGRQGLGQLRHLDTHTLWLQQAVRSKRLELKKVAGTSNPADLFTKHSLTREKVLELVELFDSKFATGRAASAPALRKEAGTKRTVASYEEAPLNNLEAHDATVEVDTEDGQPCFLPHRQHTRVQLDDEYPSLTAPEDFD